MIKHRVLVIGLDGATLDLIEPWATAGYLPNFARLLGEGSSGTLMSTIPPVSPAAWSSFMTGKNPGKHGVFDFTVRDLSSYGVKVALRPAEPTVWGLLSAQGKRVCVVNVPQCYPPEPVNGYMVTGLGTPSQRVFTYPEELTPRLRQDGYPLAISAMLQRDGPAAFEASVYQAADHVAGTALRLMGELDWDFAMVVLRLTDEIPHYFWHWMDQSHPAYAPSDVLRSEAVLRCYQKADELVGTLIAEAVDGRTTCFIMSDHGFGPLYKDVYLNEWLRQRGFLTLRKRPSSGAAWRSLLRRVGLSRTQVGHVLARLGLNGLRGVLRDGLGKWAQVFPQDSQPRVEDLVDWGRTRAYGIGYIGQIYVNLIGRDPEGIVTPGAEYERLLDELVEQLHEMVDPEDGQPVVSQVYRKQDIYDGDYVNRAPDLVVLMRNLRYITRQSYEFARRHLVFAEPPTGETGGHRREGLLLAYGDRTAPGVRFDQAEIVDLAPTILHLMGCPVPEDMDGRLLSQILDPHFMAAHPLQVQSTSGERRRGAGELTPEEEQDLLEHLRNLGYVN
jgi:predicted AlkP superfamily phosphohydrolase/phosphomutase